MKKTICSIFFGLLLAAPVAPAQQINTASGQSLLNAPQGDPSESGQPTQATKPAPSHPVQSEKSFKASARITAFEKVECNSREKWLAEANEQPGAEMIETASKVERINQSVIIRGKVNGPCNLVNGDLYVLGEVQGPVSVIKGDVTVLGQVHGPVKAVLGDVRVAGKVDGPVNVIAGRLLRSEGAHISSSTSVLNGMSEAETSWMANWQEEDLDNLLDSLVSPWAFAFWGVLLVWWLCAPALLALLMPEAIEQGETLLRANALKAVAFGLLFWAIFWFLTIAAALLCFLLVGIPILGLLALVYVAVKWFGLTVVFLWSGRRLCSLFGRQPSSLFPPLIVGAVVLGLIRMIPLLGAIVWIFAGLFAAGACVMCLSAKSQSVQRTG